MFFLCSHPYERRSGRFSGIEAHETHKKPLVLDTRGLEQRLVAVGGCQVCAMNVSEARLLDDRKLYAVGEVVVFISFID